LFDHDLPGHYLRMMRRVRASVVALIPPNQGIRATLATTGLSRVVISDGTFHSNALRRDPEMVALTSPINATGLFELDIQSELLLPFEMMGVDTSWELRMPKAANPFDYRTTADVLITIEYTALHSFDYQQQVIQQLDREMSADRRYSFREEFADQWYELHNPGQSATPMVVTFSTGRDDFPPNLDNQSLKLQHIVLYFVREEGESFEVPVADLRLTRTDGVVTAGGGGSSIDGVISTRRGNANGWKSIANGGKFPLGIWALSLKSNPADSTRDQAVQELFNDQRIQDILFVLTYSGRTPEWPT
jgi:hypothetical protein